jgi:hypothetical protein
MATIRKGGKGGKNAKSAVSFWGVAPGQPYIVSVVPGFGGAYFSSTAVITFNKNAMGSTPSSYTIFANSVYGTKTFTATSSPFTVTGLRAGTAYAFTILANAAISQAATATTSVSSSQTNADVKSVPDAPTGVTASSPSGATYDTVSWSAPTDNGGEAITNYQVESSDGKTATLNALTTNIAQEAGTAQTYRVRAYNAQGWSEWSAFSASVTTFSFVPFSVFGFSPFGVFGFSPFGVFGFSPFGFSPFGVFGFSPFGVFGFSPFGFSPFGVFGFSPFGVFGFSPGGGCIAPDTLVSVVGPEDTYIQIPAKDVVTGQEVWAHSFNEMDDESVSDPMTLAFNQLTDQAIVKTNVASIVEKEMPATMTINGDSTKKYSTVQGILYKRNGIYGYINTGLLEVGDFVMEYDYNTHSFNEIAVTSLEIDETPSTVYKFDMEPVDTFIAGNMVVHNRKT